MKKTEYLVTGSLVALLILGVLVLPGVLADETGTVTIAVNVSEASAITVAPSYLEFMNVAPGLLPIPGSKKVDVTNTGSVNFTSITININSFSTDSSNPYDTSGDPSVYSAGSFVVIYNSSMTDIHRFDNRIEWNYTRGTIADMVKTANAESWGWFYNHSLSYLWDIVPGDVGTCNASDTTLTVKQDPDSPSANRDMSVLTDTGTPTANNSEWSAFTFAATSPLSEYCVATYANCTKLMVYQYYPASAGAVGGTTLPACGAARYLVQSSGVADSEFPAGDTESFNVTVYVPTGIPAGNVTQSTMTVTAA